MTFAQQVSQFYRQIRPPKGLPGGVGVLFPQQEAPVQAVMQTFYEQYFNDNNKRVFLLGINPGRFGGGITGIPFTGPRQLTQYCQIDHPFADGSELSAEFIYEMITAFGGCAEFYARFYITAVSPLGFIKGKVNMNYYDDKALTISLEKFILKNLQTQLAFGAITSDCICIGDGKNYQYLSALNRQYGFFNHIHSLPHPRFILQYRRKQKEVYLKKYLDTLHAVLKN
jgi:Domain of unknown function (DUF4918)